MYKYFKKKWKSNPLLVIILIAFVIRLIAAIFSKGYGMHDDHFGPIEQPYHIIYHPEIWENRGTPHGHSIVYPALHYFLFLGLNYLGIGDPQDKMLIVRFIHALYSLLIVFFGYKIALNLSNVDVAKKVGILLALFWVFPFMSVRNLVEFVCIPPLMAGYYFLTKEKDEENWFNRWFWSGAMFGLAFVFRPQVLIIPFSIILILFFKKEHQNWLKLLVGCFLSCFLVQGVVDWLAWGYPFAAFLEYFIYNAGHSGDYTTGPFYNYILLMLGIFIPPMSFLLFYGFFKSYKEYFLIFFSVFCFILFHSIFPNKQERFILPILPIFIVLSVIGLEYLAKNTKFYQKFKNAIKYCWIWFWIINIALLIPFTLTYSKKSRVEALYYLSKKSDIKGLIIFGGDLGNNYPPYFYLNKPYLTSFAVKNDCSYEVLDSLFSTSKYRINYFVFYGDENLNKNLQVIKKITGKKLMFEKEIKPSFIDDLLYKLNPKRNKNQTAYIYYSEK